MSVVKNLEVKVLLNKQVSVLHTRRLQNQPVSIFLSNLAGSIVGLLGTIGFFMNVIEDKYENYLRNRIHKRSLKQLAKDRIVMIDKHFVSFETRMPDSGSPPSTYRDLLPYLNISYMTEISQNYPYPTNPISKDQEIN